MPILPARLVVAGLLIVVFAWASALPTAAQGAPPELEVATRVLPPMVVDQGGQLAGFSIDLWNRIAVPIR